MGRSGGSTPCRVVTSVLFLAAVAFLPSNLRAAEKPDVRARLIAPARVGAGTKATLVVEMAIGEHWHVNSHIPSEPYLIPTVVALTASRGNLSAVRYPKDVERRFEFADQPLRVYEGTVRFEADLEVPAGSGDASIAGDLSYQACNERQCFAPAKIRLDATIVTSSAFASSLGDTTTELR
jgi:DsbC/DsbD-like thiol-disulfide interchange protein